MINQHVIICGLGHIGFRCFEILRSMNIRTVVISDKCREDWQKKVERSGNSYIKGDARSVDLLSQANIENAFGILVVTDNDLANVSIVSDARRLNPNIKIICRLFDTGLGKHIAEAFQVTKVYSTSELAAPTFLNAANNAHALACMTHRNRNFVFTESLSKSACSIAANTDHNQELFLDLKEDSLQKTVKRKGKWVDFFIRPSMRKLRRVAFALMALILVAATIVSQQMSLSWIDSIYFVTTTVTTVGYGDFNFSSATASMKMFGIFLMLFGATGLAVFFSAIAELLLTEKFSALFGGRNIPKRGHIVLAGSDNIGTRVAQHLLQNQNQLLVIENSISGEFSGEIRRKSAVISGDPRSIETLKLAKIGNAETLLAVSSDDVWNLSVGLSAKTANPSIKTIVRVFDNELGHKLRSRLSNMKILSVSSLSSPYFVASLFCEQVLISTIWQNKLIVVTNKMSSELNCTETNIGGHKYFLALVDLNQ